MRPNAKSDTCVDGKCQFHCLEGFVNVGEGETDDLVHCVDPENDKAYCGAKSHEDPGEPCRENQVCDNGKCVVIKCLGANETLCSTSGDNECINLNNDADNCGACGYSCSAHELAYASSDSCEDGACIYSCKNSYSQCSDENTLSKIVCVNLQNDMNNCGSCGNRCAESSPEHASAFACEEGKCKYRCDEGYINQYYNNYTNVSCLEYYSYFYCGKDYDSNDVFCRSDQDCDDNGYAKCIDKQ